MYKIYSAAVRSRLEVRAPYLEAARESVGELKTLDCWLYQPAIITNEAGEILEDNQDPTDDGQTFVC